MTKLDKYTTIIIGLLLVGTVIGIAEGWNVFKAFLITIWILAMIFIILGVLYFIVELSKEMLNGKRIEWFKRRSSKDQ